jgi:hypothetical protein
MSTATLDWTDANQQFMAAELAWLKARLNPDPDAPAIAAPPDASSAAQSAVDTLVDMFELSRFERHLLLLCAGVEFDAELAAACARVHGYDGQRYVTFALALAVLPEAHWSALTPLRPLRRWRFIEIEPGRRLMDSPLRIDERILHYLAGINLLDARLQALLTLPDPPRLMADDHSALADQIAETWAACTRSLPAIHLAGDDAAGNEDIAAAIADRVGLNLFVLNSFDVPASAADIDAHSALCEREMRLLGGVLLVQCGELPPPLGLAAFAARFKSPLIVAARDPVRLRQVVIRHDVSRPATTEQKRLWLDALGQRGQTLNGALDELIGQFRLSSRAIADIAETTSIEGAGHQSALWRACRDSGRRRLDDLAERIEPAATWDDLVLPERLLSTLHQIAAHVRQRGRVYDDWGFGARGHRATGISVLFCGESGTGKTLAAEVLAHDLGLDLYRIDLSCVVNKYIGETEKNLKRVFDAAEDSGSILLFDEADALFGKRSEVKDSHDRYANIEVSYLLQRMEAYRGLAVLTTNMKAALDSAFQRRLRFVVTFPFPDNGLREAIWRRMFPPAMPIGEVHYRKLASLNLAGGHIRNIALNAAFLAADSGVPVGMDHLLAAARTETAKGERPLSEAETRGWL